MTPKLNKVIRLDSLPANQTFFTPEGYLIDRPVLTSTGIFEYHNPDGSLRRELRLPEEVFKKESLESYKSKPVIITHDAGLVDKDNVEDHIIGTILTEGYKSGDDVRAQIVIHDTNEMKKCGLKELSLGYNLDLEETPGVWNGQEYDAIQRNITINHLALVREARAGDKARLNIDSRDHANKTIGGKKMALTRNAHRADGTLSPEELEKALAEYKQRKADRMAAQKDAEEEVIEEKKDKFAVPAQDAEETEVEKTEVIQKEPVKKENPFDKKVAEVKENRNVLDKQGDPEDMTAATGVIAKMDEDMDVLFDIIDTLLAEREFNTAKKDANEEPLGEFNKLKGYGDADEELVEEEEEKIDGCCKRDACGVGEDPERGKMDADDVETEEEKEHPKFNGINHDSVDKIVRERIQLGVIAEKLNLDDIDEMSMKRAKKTVIKAVRPGMRLDGKSDTYINAMYEMACEEARSRKTTMDQKRQMFNKDSASEKRDADSSANARQRMIARQFNK